MNQEAGTNTQRKLSWFFHRTYEPFMPFHHIPDALSFSTIVY